MNIDLDMLARLLAADEHPHLAEEVGFAECARALEESPGLRAALAEEREHVAKYPRLIGLGGMPEDVRKRIEGALRAEYARMGREVPLHPWSVRRQFAWAAALVCLLAGMSLISTRIIQSQQPPLPYIARRPVDLFHAFVAEAARSGVALQRESEDTAQLVGWLAEQGGGGGAFPEGLLQRTGIGCARIQGPAGAVDILCYRQDGRILHLFAGCAKYLQMPATPQPVKLRIEGRQAVEWSDGSNVFLLITHEPGEELPTDVFL